ncbi:hypothetical protein CPC08DRAFT_729842 [Agrocybe pediades]|nr:hypothetical protein CPC08DRAFT_729842 [Agrocybe pediades]
MFIDDVSLPVFLVLSLLLPCSKEPVAALLSWLLVEVAATTDLTDVGATSVNLETSDLQRCSSMTLELRTAEIVNAFVFVLVLPFAGGCRNTCFMNQLQFYRVLEAINVLEGYTSIQCLSSPDREECSLYKVACHQRKHKLQGLDRPLMQWSHMIWALMCLRWSGPDIDSRNMLGHNGQIRLDRWHSHITWQIMCYIMCHITCETVTCPKAVMKGKLSSMKNMCISWQGARQDIQRTHLWIDNLYPASFNVAQMRLGFVRAVPFGVWFIKIARTPYYQSQLDDLSCHTNIGLAKEKKERILDFLSVLSYTGYLNDRKE